MVLGEIRNRYCYYNLTETIGNVVRLHHADDIRLRRILCKVWTLVKAALLVDQPARLGCSLR